MSNNPQLKVRLRKKYRGCQACWGTENLVVHHIDYSRRGHEELSDVVLLCAPCHNLLHKFVKGKDPDLKRVTLQFIKGRKFWA